MHNKVVITGMGIWSCIGQDIETVTENLRKGKSGIGIMPSRTDYGYQSPITGRIPMPNLENEPLRRAQKTCMAEQAQYAYMAVKQALEMAPLTDRFRVGLIVSNDSCAAQAAETEAIMDARHDSRFLGVGAIFRSLNSNVSMSLAQVFRFGGLSLTVSGACAGGLHAIGLATNLIRSGVIQACVVVGAQENGLHAYTAFDAMGIFSRLTEDPKRASRPFDQSRAGLVPSGGAAALVIESAEHAAMGNRHPIAEILGYGFSTSPDIVHPSTQDIFRTMNNAVKEADIELRDIDLITAHATATVDGDRAEAEAITALSYFRPPYEGGVGGFPTENPWVIAPKHLTGHECWMAGVSQTIYTLLQMTNGFLTPHEYLTNPDPAARTLRFPRTLEEVKVKTALINGFGFGGTNASIIIRI